MESRIQHLIEKPLEAANQSKRSFMETADYAANVWLTQDIQLVEARRLNLLTAFSSLLKFYPSLNHFILQLIKMDRISVFDKLLQYNSAKNFSADEMKTLSEWIAIVRSLLTENLNEYASLWNWSIFFTLVNDEHCDPLIRENAFITIGLLVNVPYLEERITKDKVSHLMNQMGSEHHSHLSERVFVGSNDMDAGNVSQSSTIDIRTLSTMDARAVASTASIADASDTTIVNVFGIPLYKKRNIENTLKAEPLVLTKTTVENLRMLALAVSIHKPALVEGVIGSGKTALIEELARLTGNVDMIKINLDESFDSKDLLGTYVCTDIPGEFKWQPGALTKAVTEGKWLLIEDLDLAPFDVVSSLASLVESNVLTIPSRNAHITPAVGFQLFATQCLTEAANGSFTRRKQLPMANLWNVVTVHELPTVETEILIKNKFPSLLPLVSKMIDTYETLKGRKLVEENNINSLNQLKHFGRLFSFRDLMKWCDRSHTLYSSKINPNANFVLSSVQEDIFLEAIDVFCGMLTKDSTMQSAVSLIAAVWDIPQNRASYYLQEYKPSVREFSRNVSVGRVTLDRDEDASQKLLVKSNNYATTKQALRLMEKIGVCIRMSEPALLTGETGTGKTSIIQHLARLMGRKLVVHNLNQQTDSSDFIGGFRPVDVKVLAGDLREKFHKLFKSTFSVKSNQDILVKVATYFQNGEWERMHSFMAKIVKKAFGKLIPKDGSLSPSQKMEPEAKQRKVEPKNAKLVEYWEKFEEILEGFQKQVKLVRSSFAFTFVPGSLVKALRQGHWILLDEINLASAETLERLSGLLEGKHGTLYITERGDVVPVERHPNFRLFACMNPPTDVGKKNLPPSLRNRFTEFYMSELTDRNDLSILVSKYLKRVPNPPSDQVVDFYLKAREMAQTTLSDGAGQKPHYSLRTLSRALEYSTLILDTYGLRRALYEGFCMSFMTQMDRESGLVVEKMIREAFIPKNLEKTLIEIPRQPSESHIQFQHFWLPRGEHPQEESVHFITTPTIEEHLKNLARIISVGRYPILLQGPTSAGKTTMISYLAKRTGHRFVRINNHESTDIQEYFGTYITNSEGKLVFQEGILVEAVRKGYWIVLDELNLAPTDILEALNRLLDDNRELFIPETQETIKPHPDFQLFATQNPSGAYGGRKMLSRAFRNRFQEIHVGDIPLDELTVILSKRYQTSSNLAQKMINVMKDLQRHRQGSKVFAGKSGFITPRDLFRWAERSRKIGQITSQEYAEQGYILLAERLRSEEEKQLVKETIERYFERVKIDVEKMYNCENLPEWKEAQEYLNHPDCPFPQVVWTHTMKRLFTILCQCLKSKEPILFVGETGCGKTTVCQLYSLIKGQKLHILNCHQHTEPSDFLGSLRPVRGREVVLKRLIAEMRILAERVGQLEWAAQLAAEDDVSIENIERISNELLSMSFDDASLTSTNTSVGSEAPIDSDAHKEDSMEDAEPSTTIQNDPSPEQSSNKQIQRKISELYKEWKSLFKWYDGPLIEAMKNGDMFLIDEISLAEDAVLERLNSILEPERTLTLPEKGSEVLEEYVAADAFLVMATMNPGGDYGKKELSPALRNRFTEIYVPSLSLSKDLSLIISDRLPEGLKHLTDRLVKFVRFFRAGDSRRVISIRDVVAWIDFIKMACGKLGMNSDEAFLHGAEVVILDGLGIGTDGSSSALKDVRRKCIEILLEDIPESSAELKVRFLNGSLLMPQSEWYHEDRFGCPPFQIQCGGKMEKKVPYAFNAPTTSVNVMKVLRALQIRKPILMEGSPGVGKTSLIQALSAASGHQVVRINLSEQTDMMDLLGTDLPKEGSTGGDFVWCDGIFLRALKEGHWVLLDELNLASQSVLEGLNSVLDHRGEIYIPEINQTIACPPTFRIFACQNPLQQGGGRKGLPKSFLNRFTKVYVNDFTPDDLLMIACTMHPEIAPSVLERIITFNTRMHQAIMVEFKFGRKGSPWEFNLRDVFRICELMKSENELEYPDKYISLLYISRMRAAEDKQAIINLFEETFGRPMHQEKVLQYRFDAESIEIGSTVFNIESRHTSTEVAGAQANKLRVLHSSLQPMEVALKCLELGYMTIFTGPTSAGKTSLVRLIAQMTGNSLKEFSMTSNVDTVELLGGFEQVDPAQRLEKLKNLVRSEFESALRYVLKNQSQDLIAAASKSISSIYNLWDLMGRIEKEDHLAQANHLEKIIELSADFVESNSIPSEISSFNKASFTREIEMITELLNTGAGGKFQWNDGILVEAIEKGEWALIDNVNFCSPSVLDRLNSLLEPNGVLVMNERGLVNGELKVVTPHPNFRLFLVMDPKYGEISRAMRNRGVEIFMPAIDIESQDSLTVLCAELPSIELCTVIRDYQIRYNNSLNLHESERPGIREAVRCAVLVWNEIANGAPLKMALQQAISSVYISKCKTGAQHQEATSLLTTTLAQIEQQRNAFPSALVLQSAFKIDTPQLRSLMRSSSMIYYLSTATTKAGLSIAELNHILNGNDMSISTSHSLLKNLRNACTHFIDFATPDDILTRIRFLEEMTKLQVAEDALTVLRECYSSLQMLARHSLTQNILDRYPASMVGQIRKRPFDLRLAPSVLSKLNSSIDASQMDSLTTLYKKIQLSTEWIHSTSREESLLTSQGDFSKLPLMNQSYLCYVKKELRNRVEHNSISFFYILLSVMCSKYVEYTLSPECNDICLDEHFEAFSQFVVSRSVLFAYLSENKTLVPELLVHWNIFSKHLRHLPQCSNVELWSDLIVVHNELDHLLAQFFQSFGKKNNLWKYGGKPRPDSSPASLAQRKDLETLAEDARKFRNEKVNQILLKGMCSMYWMGEDGSKSDDLLASLERIPEMIMSENAKVKPRQTKEEQLQNIFSHYNKKSGVQFNKHSADAILPLFEHKSLQLEMDTLTEILTTIHKLLFRDGNSLEDEAHLLSVLIQKCEALISFVTGKTVRSPVDMTYYQIMVWKLKSAKHLTESNLEIILSLFHTCAFMWHNRLWNNDLSIENNTNSTLEISAVTGPNAMFYDVKSVWVMSLLQDWVNVPIRLRFTKIDQMKTVVNFLCSSEESSTLTSDLDWKMLAYTFTNTLMAFEKSFPDQSMSFALRTWVQNFTAFVEKSFPGKKLDAMTDIDSDMDSHFVGQLDAILASSTDNRVLECKFNGKTLFQQLAIDIYEGIHKQRNGAAHSEDMSAHGYAWCLLGFLRCMLIIPGQPIDPSLKYSVMLEKNLLPHLKGEKEKHQLYNKIQSFENGGATNPRIEQISYLISILEEKISFLQDKVVARPDNIMFTDLYRDMKQFLSMLSTHNNYLDLIASISSPGESAEEALAKEAAWQFNAMQAVRRLSSYRGFDDIWVPFTECIGEIRYGMRITAFACNAKISKKEHVTRVVEFLLDFPFSTTVQSLHETLKVINNILNAPSSSISSSFDTYDKYTVLLNAVETLLLRASLVASHDPEMNNEFIKLIGYVFETYTQIHDRITNDIRRKQEEEEAAIKYKKKVTVIETDEERVEKEMNAMLPTYVELYSDFLAVEDKEDPNRKITPDEFLNLEEASSSTISKLEKLYESLNSSSKIEFIMRMHKAIFSSQNRKSSTNAPGVEITRSELLEMSFKSAMFFLEKSKTMDFQFSSSSQMTLLCYSSQALEKLQTKIEVKPGHFDIYNDSNISEVSIAFNLLNDFVQRLKELLKKYEENPNLIQLIQVCERILNRPISSPVAGVLTGLEVLCKLANEWEEYLTSPAGSIKEHIHKILSLISRWRRIELENWKSILTSKRKSHEQKDAKWWFQFYKLFNLGSFNPKTQEEKQSILNNVFSIIDDYLRMATYGDLRFRVNMLKLFSNQIKYEQDIAGFSPRHMSAEMREALYNLVENMRKFYGLFVPLVEEHIDSQAKVLEDKLNEFISIAKWEDSNYYSVTNAGKKARSHLAKLSHGFGEILSTPCSTAWQTFSFVKSDEAREERRKRFARLQQESLTKQMTLLKSSLTSNIGAPQADVSSLIQIDGKKVLQIFERGSSIVQKKLIDGPFALFLQTGVEHIENLSTEIIVRSQKFSKSKDPQNVKKRALLMLLTELKEMGLRHQRKTIEQYLTNENIFQQGAVVDSIVDENEKAGKGPFALMAENWTSSEDLFFKNIYLLQKLKIEMKTPNEDLNQSELARMLGYSDNLFYILMKIRLQMQDGYNSQMKLKSVNSILHDTSGLHKEKLSVCQHALMETSVNAFNAVITEAIEYVHQVYMLNESLSQSAGEEYKGAAKYNLSLCKAAVTTLQRNIVLLNNLRKVKIFTEHHFEELRSCFEQCMSSFQSLSNLKSIGGGRFDRVNNFIHELQISFNVLASSQQLKNTSHVSEESLVSAYEEISKMIQITVQKIVSTMEDYDKKRLEFQEEANGTSGSSKPLEEGKTEASGDVAAMEDEEESFVSYGTIKIFKSYPLKQMKTVSTWINHTVSAIEGLVQVLNACDNISPLQAHIRNMASLVDQFSAHLSTVFFSVVSVQKSLTKLLYVLLNTFNSLVKDGFCSSEAEEEGEWSGETEFQDGTGMDDGEGCKDVSDEIENEDQLLNEKDMKPNENERDLEDNDDKGLEMESDFNSKMYDHKKDQQEEDDEDDKEDEEEDELDKEMGDIEDDDPNKETVDKSMWEDEDRDKDLEKDDSKEDQSKPNEAEMQEELAAKEEDNDEEQQDVEDAEHKPKKQNNLPEREEAPEDGEQPDQPEFKDAVEGTEEGEQQESPDEEFKDKNQPEFEDLNLEDDISEKSDDDADEPVDDVDESDGEEDNMRDDLVTEGNQNGQQEEEDDNVQTEDVDMDDAQQEEEDEQKDADAPDASLQNEAGDQMEDEGEGEDPDQKEETSDPNLESLADNQDLQEVPYGVQSTAGKSSEIKDSEPEEKETKDRDINGGEEGGDDINKADQGTSHQQRSKDSNDQDREETNTQFDPNPYRSLGDALKEWKEQLNIVDNKEDSKEDDGKEGDDYEFKDDKDEMRDDDIQMKAPATQEQSEVLPEIAEDNDEEDNNEDEENAKEEKFEGDERKPSANQELGGGSQKEKEKNANEDEETADSMEDDSGSEADEMEDDESEDISPGMDRVKESTTHTTHEVLGEKVEKAEQEEFSMEDLRNLNMEQDTEMSEWRSNGNNLQKSTDLWQEISSQTSHLSQELCEQLRLILEPSLATKLKGDYKTGKRINMKKVIPYIASQFKKDKIWLRRTKPNKREYQVMVAIDDSLSMRQCNSGKMALQAMTLICKAMTQLEVGQIAVASFGQSMKLLHRFDQPFSDASGADVIGQFNFDQQQTQLASFLAKAIQVMDLYKSMRFTASTDLLQQLQLGIIISDGRLLERETIISLLREAQEKNQMFIFVLIDNSEKESVLDIQSVSYESGSIQIKNYMDEFPFPYYIILRDVNTLPDVLSNALRQWFELISIIMGDNE